jgi:hypothetical protein
MPAGICTIESRESRPFSVFDWTGTPSTGSDVFAAAIPGADLWDPAAQAMFEFSEAFGLAATGGVAEAAALNQAMVTIPDTLAQTVAEADTATDGWVDSFARQAKAAGETYTVVAGAEELKATATEEANARLTASNQQAVDSSNVEAATIATNADATNTVLDETATVAEDTLGRRLAVMDSDMTALEELGIVNEDTHGAIRGEYQSTADTSARATGAMIVDATNVGTSMMGMGDNVKSGTAEVTGALSGAAAAAASPAARARMSELRRTDLPPFSKIVPSFMILLSLLSAPPPRASLPHHAKKTNTGDYNLPARPASR